MYSSMSSHSYDKEQRPRATSSALSHAPEHSYSSTSLAPNAPLYQRSHSIGDILEPAMDGPPSPDRIRVFSSHKKRNSSTDKHRSELTMSSGSSSRLSATSDRQSWNQSRESLGLSRNPSQRSSSTGTPSHERPDSLQFFGKGIFRKGKLRRGSSDQGSSNSSLDAVESSNESKEQHFIQSVFTRRRALRGEPSASTQRKLQISGPYNFQHLTHTHKDSVPDLDNANRLELVSEFASLQIQGGRRHTEAFLEGIPHGESRFPSYSETSYHQEDPSVGLNADGAHLRASQPPPLPPLPPIRLTKRSQSQDKIRVPPPRPPRSPIGESSMMPLGQPQVPPTQQVHHPPRTSSRTSVRHDRFGSISGASVERSGSSFSFRNPQPFAPSSPSRAQTPHAPLVSPVMESEYEEPSPLSKVPHAVTTTEEVAWPLSNSISSLPDVPEEEEHHAQSRPSRSRMSVASNHSSLRGSVSVPLLRQFSMNRSTSNASDTLGKFDFSSQRATQANTRDYSIDGIGGDSWEDDIDYCYEHEAEANCDYAWERPSCDIRYPEEVRGRSIGGQSLGGQSLGGQSLGSQSETVITFGRLSDAFLSPGSTDVPILSPASQISSTTAQEALTPNLSLPVTSNFSLPRRESSAQLLRDNSRSQTPERNFKEAQAFSLSPSLLIPDDYHQQMLQYQREGLEDDSDDDELVIQGNTLDEPIIRFGKNLKPSNARSSASTTDSRFSEHSMTSSRHKSTTSTSTGFTRWTGSSMSSWQGRDSTQHILTKPAGESGPVVIVSPTQATTPMTPMTAMKFDEEISPKQEPNREKHGRTQSHAGLLMRTNYDAPAPVAAAAAAESKPAAKEPPKTRRRARTTSRSHAAPLALFPTVNPLPGGRI